MNKQEIDSFKKKEESYRTQSLYHYTSTIDNVANILKEKKLYPQFCSENLGTDINPKMFFGIPQICCCDIPVSMAKTMRSQYGNFAIAFSKEWGIKKGFNPIFYTQDERVINSYLVLYELANKYLINKKAEIRCLNENDENYENEVSTYYRERFDYNSSMNFIFGYIKKYKGEWKNEDYYNYEENEWRYIVEDGKVVSNNKTIRWKTAEEYKKWRGEGNKPEISEDLKECALEFSYDDITDILVEEGKSEEMKNRINSLQITDTEKQKLTNLIFEIK